MWLGAGTGETWRAVKGKAGRDFQKTFLSIPNSLRQLRTAGAATGRASGGEELGKQRMPLLRDWRMWQPQTTAAETPEPSLCALVYASQRSEISHLRTL